MAHFLKTVDDDGYVSYVNLDMIIFVDEDERKITLVDGKSVEFCDDSDAAEWRQVMKFVNYHKFY